MWDAGALGAAVLVLGSEVLADPADGRLHKDAGDKWSNIQTLGTLGTPDPPKSKVICCSRTETQFSA